MLVDCESCPVRGRHCAECVVNTLFGEAPSMADLTAEPEPSGRYGDDAERRALEALTGAGFEVTVLAREAPRLRLISSPGGRGRAA
jgi:hypothetical protein